jgi:hypothetical protein
VGGSCVDLPCAGNQVRCNGNCVDILSDMFNCGGCAATSGAVEVITCLTGETCFCANQGQVECPYSAPYSFCADTQADPYNCGGCGVECATNEQCVAGACQALDCVGGVACGHVCTTNTSCGVACDYRAGELCGNGVCYQGT